MRLALQYLKIFSAITCSLVVFNISNARSFVSNYNYDNATAVLLSEGLDSFTNGSSAIRLQNFKWMHTIFSKKTSDYHSSSLSVDTGSRQTGQLIFLSTLSLSLTLVVMLLSWSLWKIHREREILFASHKQLLAQYYELQHRSLNIAQHISELISGKYVETHRIGKHLARELTMRISSISRLYALLHNGQDLYHINMNDYLLDLSDSLGRVFDREHDTIVRGSLILNPSQAIKVGRLVNEILMNSLKHAVQADMLELTIILNENNMLCQLIISDNGEGAELGVLTKEGSLRIANLCISELHASHDILCETSGLSHHVQFSKA
jgi:two-component sensor histidine kinase